jgi:hypothetical protein
MMQTDSIIASYQQVIHNIEEQMQRASDERLNLADWERKVEFFEAGIVRGGLDGSNETARRANLALALDGCSEYRGLREATIQVRQRIANADKQLAVAKEQCRLYRLMLALAVPDGVRELAAA